MKKQRISSSAKRRRSLRSVGGSFLHRIMRCEQLESRSLMHGMPWQVFAETESSWRSPSEFDRAAYFSTLDLDSEGEPEGSTAGSTAGSSFEEHHCDRSHRTDSIEPEGEGGPLVPADSFGATSAAFMRPGIHDRSDNVHGGLGGQPAANAPGVKTELINDAKSGLIPDNSAKLDSNDQSLPRGIAGDRNATSGISNANGLSNRLDMGAAFSLNPQALNPQALNPQALNPQALGDLLLALKGNLTSPPAGNAGSNAAVSNVSLNNAPRGGGLTTFETRDPSSALLSSSSSASLGSFGTANTTSSTNGSQSVISGDRTFSTSSLSSATQSSETQRNTESTRRYEAYEHTSVASSNSLEFAKSNGKRSSGSAVDEAEPESSGLLSELRAQIERLAKQRATERNIRSNDDAARADQLAANATSSHDKLRSVSRRALLLAQNGLLELSSDRPQAASNATTAASMASHRDLQAHAAAFAAIAMYREFDLLVEPNQTSYAPASSAASPPATIATAGRDMLRIGSAGKATVAGDESKSAADAESSLADRALLPLSFLALGGFIFRRRLSSRAHAVARQGSRVSRCEPD